MIKKSVRSKFNLLNEFNKYNELLFNNELKPINLKWGYHKRFFGRTGIIRIKVKPKVYLTEEIVISYYYDYDYDFFKNVLVHEMIHAYIIQKKYIDDDSHGNIYMSIANEIDKKGFNTALRIMDSRFVDIHDKSPLKDEVFTIMYRNDDKILCSIFDKSSINEIGKIYFKTLKHDYGKDFEIIVSKTNDYRLKRYSITKSIHKKIQCYTICQNIWDDLIKTRITLTNVNKIE